MARHEFTFRDVVQVAQQIVPIPLSWTTPAAPLVVEEQMPPKKPDISADELFMFFADKIPSSVMNLAHERGYLFNYDFIPDKPNAQDRENLKEFATLCFMHLGKHPAGKFKVVPVKQALELLAKTTGKDFGRKIPLKVQANNYIKYFSDVSTVKRSSVTLGRLPSWLAQLCKAMQTGHQYLFVFTLPCMCT